jgi:hypothetical protein
METKRKYIIAVLLLGILLSVSFWLLCISVSKVAIFVALISVLCLTYIMLSLYVLKNVLFYRQRIERNIVPENKALHITEKTEKSDEQPAINSVQIVELIISENKDNLEMTFHRLCNYLQVVQGVFYQIKKNIVKPTYFFAFPKNISVPAFEIGEGLPGQAVLNKEITIIDNIPENHNMVFSGLGKAKPSSLVLIPVYSGQEPVALLELSFFRKLNDTDHSLFKIISTSIANNEMLNNHRDSI